MLSHSQIGRKTIFNRLRTIPAISKADSQSSFLRNFANPAPDSKPAKRLPIILALCAKIVVPAKPRLRPPPTSKTQNHRKSSCTGTPHSSSWYRIAKLIPSPRTPFFFHCKLEREGAREPNLPSSLISSNRRVSAASLSSYRQMGSLKPA